MISAKHAGLRHITPRHASYAMHSRPIFDDLLSITRLYSRRRRHFAQLGKLAFMQHAQDWGTGRRRCLSHDIIDC